MKGDYGQECNITACQKPNSAYWYNHFNQKYYCEDCASRLNNDEYNKRDAQRLLGHQMCTYENRANTLFKNVETSELSTTIPENTMFEVKRVDWEGVSPSGREQRRLRRKFERRTKKK